MGRDTLALWTWQMSSFPVPELDIRKDSVWNPFLEKGYIKEFHETMVNSLDRDSVLPDFLGCRRIFWEITMFA